MKSVKIAKFLVAVVLLLLLMGTVGICFGWSSGRFAKKVRHIILISIDTCRADYLSCYGYRLKTTPNIDALANESILFENVVTPSPLTLPAHSTMLTGTIPPYHGARMNTNYRLGDSNLTIAEILRKNGYKTGAVIGTSVLESQFGISQGFENYNDRFLGKREPGFEHRRRAAEVSNFAVKWLAENANEDFFLFLHYFDPHAQYIPPEPFASKFADNPYAGEIAYTDYCIGQVINKLKDLNIYDSTLLIITSDHGESIGEHGENTHGYFIYNPTIKVPLIFKLPEKNEPKRIKETVGLVDIVPTILSQLGVLIPSHVQGKSLSGYFDEKTENQENRYFYCESLVPTMLKCNSLHGLACNDWKYIQTSRPELYDLKNDPNEINNLIDNEPKQSALLKNRLKKILALQSRRNQTDSKFQADQESIERLKGLGYLGGNVSENEQLTEGGDDPKDYVKLYNQIVELLILRAKGQKEEAKSACEEILHQRPGLGEIYNVLGNILKEEADFEGAMKHFSMALKSKPKNDPDNSIFHCNLADILAKQGKDDEAVYHYSQALRINPNHSKSHCHLATILLKRGNINDAFEHLSKALKINPNDSEAHYHLATILAGQGKSDQAIKHFSETVKLTPDHAIVHYHFANCLASAGKTEQAISEYHQTLHLSPDRPEPANQLAWILATHRQTKYRNPAEAVRLAELACRKTNYNNAEFLNTLAAAYASAGRNMEAIKTAEKALRLARSKGQQNLAAEIQRRLQMYKHGQF